ncbi:MAG: hypothetical protein V8Q93_05060 [Blautia faecis]
MGTILFFAGILGMAVCIVLLLLLPKIKKCLTIPCGSGIVNKLSQGIASEMLKNKIVFRKFELTVDK